MNSAPSSNNLDQSQIEARINLADEIVSSYNFGEGVSVASMDNWDVSDQDDLTKIIYVEFDTDGQDDDSHRVSFHVRFTSGLTVADAYALEMEKGNDIGSRGDNLASPQG